MKKNTFSFSIGILSSIFLLAACGSAGPRNQMKFGIQAAQSDLWDEAIFRWQKVLKADPESAAAHNNLAVAYERKGLWENAEQEYQRALRLDPENEYIQSNYNKFQRNLEATEDDPELEKKEKKDVKNFSP